MASWPLLLDAIRNAGNALIITSRIEEKTFRTDLGKSFSDIDCVSFFWVYDDDASLNVMICSFSSA